MVGNSPLILLNDLLASANRNLPPGVAALDPLPMFAPLPIGLLLVATALAYWHFGAKRWLPDDALKGVAPARTDSYFAIFAVACFGAQAVLFGLMALVTRWSARSFAAFAVLLLPFFGFNYWFHYEVPVLTSIGMLDFAGNVTMLVLGMLGWRAARTETA